MKNFDDSTYYHYKLIFNSKITARIKLFMRLSFLLFVILISLLLSQLYTFYSVPTLSIEFILVQFLAGAFLAPILHQVLHGIAYFSLGIVPGLQIIPTIGLPTPKWHSEKMVIKRNYIFILSTPLILGTGMFAMLMVLLPTFWYFLSALLVINISLSAIDSYWLWQIRGMHHAVTIRSSNHGFNVYKV
ncbi:DUF3267 domain-containing protein [Desulfuribacillus alkaliarsenatis]|uniref:DUF3267 domain-containing protein n=1 Tax=Desulfuribacillus alkaliarsenatis TaxID=766136 RepID=A0A1E5FYT4_9FIRM|nr:DUF3267 domain-containing protein [Desulfuribacillus alkaliarsenatis]OEF95734.1 hypothetical protein BHF68_11590 [Desulfuribacillus alkaliarsenatis]